MKKYFLYELKKHIWTLVVLTAVCAIPYIVSVASLDMFYMLDPANPVDYRIIINDPNLSMVFVELIILLFVAPCIVYSFKMSKRGVDGYYSLPLKKEKLYFVSTMVGLILVLVPFTVSYWGGFLTLLMRPENPYKMGYYVPTYFGGLCFAIFLYGVNAFVFTRANRVIDGLVFMAAYAFVGLLTYEFVWNVFDIQDYHGRFNYSIQSAFFFGGGMIEFMQEELDFITGYKGDFSYAGWWFGMTILAGVICYALLFYLLRYEKGENAEQNSNSWFGYKMLIPVYVALSLGTGAGEEPFGLVLVLVAGIVVTIVHKRKFSLKLADWAPLAIGFVAGLIFAAMAG